MSGVKLRAGMPCIRNWSKREGKRERRARVAVKQRDREAERERERTRGDKER